MNINERQFQYLQTMGVSLWQSRPQFFQNNLPSSDVEQSATEPEVVTTKTVKTIEEDVQQESAIMHSFDNIEQFFSQPLSIDILIALNCDKSNVLLTTAGVQLDTLLWQFSSDDKCSYKEQTLTTPNLINLSKSNQLKSALWACLCSHINNCNN
ncbi:DNA polymerase III subunit psi [Thalassotalea psychrophila]|uniref:DNA polymerase III subunit psi n=1 Tax=Thalassotalea psychrophila TaxID=3065647 RepID=A0ABY9TX60_9GAMM|nr:DNA polymerase III subunit psi [Colwelliaceae bacterium SQ149]